MWLSVIDDLIHYGFLLSMGLAIFFLTGSMLYLLVMHFLMPRAILDKYFNPPYFGEFERALYTGIPYAPMRTIMLMSVIAFPSLGKKRNLTEVYKDAPRWYRIGSRLFIYHLFFIVLGGIGLLFLLGAVTFSLQALGII